MFKSIFKAFWQLIKAFIPILKYPAFLIAVFLALIGVSCLVYAVKYRKELRSRPKSGFVPLPKRSLFAKIFIDAPRMFILDRVNRPANFFPVHGLIIFEGRQGSGKTSSMVHYLHDLQKQYPHVKTITNFCYTGEDMALFDWHQLVDYKNGYEGVVVAMDELQNWFSCKQSANFPPEMLSVVTQNRKNRRVILGTAQNFYMLSKDIRTQCTELRRCLTIGGVFTIVHRLRPVCNSAGEVEKYDHVGWYTWVHTPQERDSYDTYKAIENLAASGFKEKEPQQSINFSVTSSGKSSKSGSDRAMRGRS